MARKKLVLAVIDSLRPEMLDRAIADGRAPALAGLVERGTFVRDCVSTFPSVTPVASATIATGLDPGEHRIPGMNWFHRGEQRYVEYGSSFQATRAFGLLRSLHDTVYNMNMAHLTRDRKTVFEHLDDAGLRTACTTYLIYRGRTRHELDDEAAYGRLAKALQFRHAVWGARELFYADLFDSRSTGCRSTLGLPGQRDQHTGCVGAHLVEHDLFDFMLFSLPDTDTHSHRRGPDAQVTAIENADRALDRIMHVAGGLDAFLEDHAVIVMSDHAQTAVERSINLAEALPERRVLGPGAVSVGDAEVAVCPNARGAMVYALGDDDRERRVSDLASDLRALEGADVVAHRSAEAGGAGEAVVWSPRGELRFAPGGDWADARDGSWSVDGDPATLDLTLRDGRVRSGDYPDALGRLWSAFESPNAGDLLLSAAPGYEFVDWGGAHHVGGGSHGSLHRGDSHSTLVMCGLEGDEPQEREQWALADVTPLALKHFSVGS
ncbi:MAG: alkaline phosphatase family protein [Thermoleophilaceae bacterium]|nr:alkaline phosphatase family protein [Thermoleophilaceae bacterium]